MLTVVLQITTMVTKRYQHFCVIMLFFPPQSRSRRTAESYGSSPPMRMDSSPPLHIVSSRCLQQRAAVLLSRVEREVRQFDQVAFLVFTFCL